MTPSRSPSRSIIRNRFEQFATLYDPENIAEPEDDEVQPGERGDEPADTLRIEFRRGYFDYRTTCLKRNPTCHFCGCKVTRKSSNMDHLLPVSRGGRDSPANLVLTCKECNEDKSNDTPSEWLERVVRELQRLTAVRDRIEELSEAGQLEFYQPVKPKPVTIAPKSAVPTQRNPDALSPVDFKLGKPRFDIVDRDGKRLIRGLRKTDLQHFLNAVGYDDETAFTVLCIQHWHTKENETVDDSTAEA